MKRLDEASRSLVVSNRPARTALKAYARRWGIECLFGDTKTRGFNMEDTRLTDPRKLDLLIGLVALAVAWTRPIRPHPALAPRPGTRTPRLPQQVMVPHRLRPGPKAPAS